MSTTIHNRDSALIWQEKHEPSAPKMGEQAPEFKLFDIAGKNSVRLSDFRGERPVALVFGSFT